MYNFTDALIEDIVLDESKQDIQNFIDKFSEDTYELFKKSNQRLKNKGFSTDLNYYVKKVSKEELDNLLSQLERRVDTKADEVGDGIRGEYKYFGEKNGFKVYQPIDAQASMDLGYMTGWCTTGRYGHAGEKNYKPSLEHAKAHFDDYTKKGIKLFYFLNDKMEGQYALALMSSVLTEEELRIRLATNGLVIDNIYVTAINFELYNQEDECDYSALSKLPIDLIQPKIDLIMDGLQIDEDSRCAISNGVLEKYCGSGKNVVIPAGVHAIGDEAFWAMKDLVSVTIPDGVTSISYHAFGNCSSLTSIKLPKSLTTIGTEAFSFCRSLKSISIPNGVKHISEKAFSYCSSLTSIVIPNSVASIGKGAFCGCFSFTSITIPNSVTSIGNFAFEGCSSLTTISLPSSVKTIDDYAFADCTSLASVSIPNSVTSIGDWVFKSCPSLASINIPDSVTSIAPGAFYDCRRLKSIVIPDSVTNIGRLAFACCISLRSISIPSSVIDMDVRIFERHSRELVVTTDSEYVKKYCKECGVKCQMK